MRIIHVADVHLGASNRKLSSSLQKNLKLENANRLKFVFEYADKINAGAIIISGDLFHSKNPSNQLVKFFVEILSSCKIPVFYVKGNHDEDFTFTDVGGNFKIFDKYFSSVELEEGVVISGQSGNQLDLPPLNPNKFNVVLMHGDIHSKGNDYIDLSLCKNKNINYLALGHIHSYENGRLDTKGRYVYSGCLTGNGFDECGEKGFVILDTQSGQIEFKEIKGKKFVFERLDITNFKGYEDLDKKIETLLKKYSFDDFIRLELFGEYEEDQDKFIGILTNKYSNLYSYFEIIDKSKIELDAQKLRKEVLSFKAEFLKLVFDDPNLTDDEKNEVCRLGISALRGDDIWNY